jgi:hypothetical protein
MKELINWRHGVAATTLLAAGSVMLTGCGHHESSTADPNKLTDCDYTWAGGQDPVKSLAETSAHMQHATSELIAKMGENYDTQDGLIPKDKVAPQLRAAANILTSISITTMYNTNYLPMSVPANEFCLDTGYVYKTPQFVAAEQALQVAGIELASETK